MFVTGCLLLVYPLILVVVASRSGRCEWSGDWQAGLGLAVVVGATLLPARAQRLEGREDRQRLIAGAAGTSISAAVVLGSVIWANVMCHT